MEREGRYLERWVVISGGGVQFSFQLVFKLFGGFIEC